ncbi:MAG: ABC transporter ATP-binding protein, partial [Rhodospirillales bacterium]
MTQLVEVKSLSKHFGTIKAVDDLSFSVSRGDVLGFLGPNGSGKTTTMRMITGFLPPTLGTAIVDGFDVQENPVAVKERIGYLPEGAPLYGEMTPATFLEFIASSRGLSGADKQKRIDEAADRLALSEILDQRIETLSKGFKRRVGIAQTILHDPDVLILDEPTAGVSPIV